MNKAEEKEGGFYVVEGKYYIKVIIKAVEISSESEPDEIDDLSGIEDIRVQDIEDLDKLMATTKSKYIKILIK